MHGLPFSTLTIPSTMEHCLMTLLLVCFQMVFTKPSTLSNTFTSTFSEPANPLCCKASGCATLHQLRTCEVAIWQCSTRVVLSRMQTSTINGMLTLHASSANIFKFKQRDRCVLNRTSSLQWLQLSTRRRLECCRDLSDVSLTKL